MKQMITIICLLLLFTQVVAQDQNSPKDSPVKPDLSGRWSIERDAAVKVGGVLKRDIPDLIIEHREPELKIRRMVDKLLSDSVINYLYYSDKRGEINPGFKGTKVNSKSSWSGRSLVIRYTMMMEFDKLPELGNWVRTSKVDVVEKWELSKDGKKLTHRINASGMPSAGAGTGSVNYDMNAKEVFIRSQ